MKTRGMPCRVCFVPAKFVRVVIVRGGVLGCYRYLAVPCIGIIGTGRTGTRGTYRLGLGRPISKVTESGEGSYSESCHQETPPLIGDGVSCLSHGLVQIGRSLSEIPMFLSACLVYVRSFAAVRTCRLWPGVREWTAWPMLRFTGHCPHRYP